MQVRRLELPPRGVFLDNRCDGSTLSLPCELGAFPASFPCTETLSPEFAQNLFFLLPFLLRDPSWPRRSLEVFPSWRAVGSSRSSEFSFSSPTFLIFFFPCASSTFRQSRAMMFSPRKVPLFSANSPRLSDRAVRCSEDSTQRVPDRLRSRRFEGITPDSRVVTPFLLRACNGHFRRLTRLYLPLDLPLDR